MPQKRKQSAAPAGFEQLETRAFCQMFESEFGVTVIVVRFVVQIRQMRNGEEKNSARFEDAMKILKNPQRIANVFQHLRTEDRIERAVVKGERL